ncbi:MAG: glucose-6-phosphate isomerase, partial [Gallicola sp.]|nr:glucose-6-phosphate isomerase [Gallicola sp.]
MRLDFSRLDMEKKMETLRRKSLEALQTLTDGTGPGNDFLGWVDQPVDYDKEEFGRILKAGEKIRKHSEILVVIGIGGSYLGTKAVDYALSPYFPTEEGSLQLVYAGHHISSTYMKQLIDYLKDKEYSINVVSKSGTTTEPSIAFRFLKDEIEKKYGEAAKDRIFATTDKEKGALKGLSDEMGYETFVVPDDIGGRYSVLSAVGLLPLAAAGYDIESLMDGAIEAREKYNNPDFEETDALKYATARNI